MKIATTSLEYLQSIIMLLLNMRCFALHIETLLKVTLLHRCFSRFFNCTNGTKWRNASHILHLMKSSETSVKWSLKIK